MIYNKLVRDKIPEIILANNKKCSTKILKQEEYLKALHTKIGEELLELQNCKNIKEITEELSDLLELIHAIGKFHGILFDDIENTRIKKFSTKGGFDNRIFLIGVEK